MKNLLACFCLILSMSACGNTAVAITLNAANKDTVTLVFKPDVRNMGLEKPMIPYTIEGSSQLSTMTPERLPLFCNESDMHDTLKLAAIDGHLEIALLYGKIQYLYYFLKGGDTVAFSRNESGIPIARSSTSSELTWQYNFPYTLAGAFDESGYTPEMALTLKRFNKQKAYPYMSERYKFRNYSSIFSATTDESDKEKHRMFEPNDAYAGLEPYYNSFLSATHDTIALSHLKEEFAYRYFSTDMAVTSADLVLADAEGKTTTFDALLSKFRGKVIYVDFWASWCSPCKQSMPDAKALRKEYQGKDIVIYQAIPYRIHTALHTVW